MKYLKVGSAIGTAGAVAGGATALSLHFTAPKTSNIVKKFKEIGYEVLDTLKDEGWDEIFADYDKAPTNEKFPGTKEDLKNHCKEALNKNDDKAYSLAKRWCVKKETVKQMLTKQGFKSLDANGKINSDPIWKAKVEELIRTGNSKIKFGGGITGDISKDTVLVWGACKVIEWEELSTTSQKYEEEFIKAKEWCSNRQN